MMFLPNIVLYNVEFPALKGLKCEKGKVNSNFCVSYNVWSAPSFAEYQIVHLKVLLYCPLMNCHYVAHQQIVNNKVSFCNQKIELCFNFRLFFFRTGTSLKAWGFT